MIDRLLKKRRKGRKWYDCTENAALEKLRASDVSALDGDRFCYNDIGCVLNRDTGMKVEFVHSAYRRIVRCRLYNPRMMGKLGLAFRDAVYFGKTVPDNKSRKPNLACLRVFRGKMKVDSDLYTLVYIVHDIRGEKEPVRQLYTVRIYRFMG